MSEASQVGHESMVENASASLQPLQTAKRGSQPTIISSREPSPETPYKISYVKMSKSEEPPPPYEEEIEHENTPLLRDDGHRLRTRRWRHPRLFAVIGMRKVPLRLSRISSVNRGVTDKAAQLQELDQLVSRQPFPSTD